MSQIYFDKGLYTFRTDLLSVFRSLNTVYTAIDIFVMLVMLASASKVRMEHPDLAFACVKFLTAAESLKLCELDC